MPDVNATKIIIEVTAGALPGQPEPEFTRRYSMGSARWEELQKQGPDAIGAALAELIGQAQGYANLLMLQPDRYNWVRLEWVYL